MPHLLRLFPQKFDFQQTEKPSLLVCEFDEFAY